MNAHNKDQAVTLRLTGLIERSAVTDGYKLYKEGAFRDAIPKMQCVLDMEPNNWLARLILGACFARSGQQYAADCAFRHIMDNCKDEEIRERARLAAEATRTDNTRFFHSTINEFCDYRTTHKRVILDAICEFPLANQ